jgi:hypothetical protein
MEGQEGRGHIRAMRKRKGRKVEWEGDEKKEK